MWSMRSVLKVDAPPDEAVDLVALAQQEFGEVAAVLAGDAGDDRASWA